MKQPDTEYVCYKYFALHSFIFDHFLTDSSYSALEKGANPTSLLFRLEVRTDLERRG